jgi:hypothetical protein
MYEMKFKIHRLNSVFHSKLIPLFGGEICGSIYPGLKPGAICVLSLWDSLIICSNCAGNNSPTSVTTVTLSLSKGLQDNSNKCKDPSLRSG